MNASMASDQSVAMDHGNHGRVVMDNGAVHDHGPLTSETDVGGHMMAVCTGINTFLFILQKSAIL